MGWRDRLSDLADTIVESVSPGSAVERARARMALGYARENGYLVPGSARKSMRGVTATLNSPAQDIDSKIAGSRALSRDMAMNTTLATAIFRRLKTNVIGAGLQVQPRPDWKYLGITEETAQEFVQDAIREFDMWAGSQESDYTGQASFNEQQGLLFVQALYDGDAFFTLPWVASQRSGWPYETTVRVIDADLVRTPDEDWLINHPVPTTAKIRNGVEYDANGRLAAYWVANYYRNDYWDLEDIQKSFARIPVYDINGERQIFHVLEHERHAQRRGIPLLAPVVDQLKQFSRLAENELMAHLMASLFTVFIRDQSGMGGLLQEGFIPSETVDGGGGYGINSPQEAKADSAPYNYELGPGSIYYLDDNKDISIAETRDKKDIAPFFKAMASLVAAAIEIPHDVVMLTFDNSYSALRGAVLEASKRYEVLRKTHGKSRIVQPVYEAVMHEAILKGRIKAPRFFDDIGYRQAWLRAEVVGAGWGQIDPVKEAKAAVLKISNGLSTHEEQYALDRGGRWQSMIERAAAERAIMFEAGIPTESTLDGNGPDLEGGA